VEGTSPSLEFNTFPVSFRPKQVSVIRKFPLTIKSCQKTCKFFTIYLRIFANPYELALAILVDTRKPYRPEVWHSCRDLLNTVAEYSLAKHKKIHQISLHKSPTPDS
jgi:hypothetical protein